MKPINLNNSINKGILVFFPALNTSLNYLLKLEIFYTKSNPLFNWINCDNSEQKIFEEVSRESKSGILFNYNIPTDLEAGFYTFKSTLIDSQQPKEGQLTIGLFQNQSYIVIGLPYSMYPPITLS